MKYFMVTAKCGHVGKNKYYKGTLFLTAENAKEAAKKARECPRVKHDQKNAILSVDEIDYLFFTVGCMLNDTLHYYTCKNVQEQRIYISEIENNIFEEEWIENDIRKNKKKHSLRNVYNSDPEYESYKTRKYVEYYAA